MCARQCPHVGGTVVVHGVHGGGEGPSDGRGKHAVSASAGGHKGARNTQRRGGGRRHVIIGVIAVLLSSQARAQDHPQPTARWSDLGAFNRAIISLPRCFTPPHAIKLSKKLMRGDPDVHTVGMVGAAGCSPKLRLTTTATMVKKRVLDLGPHRRPAIRDSRWARRRRLLSRAEAEGARTHRPLRRRYSRTDRPATFLWICGSVACGLSSATRSGTVGK